MVWVCGCVKVWCFLLFLVSFGSCCVRKANNCWLGFIRKMGIMFLLHSCSWCTEIIRVYCYICFCPFFAFSCFSYLNWSIFSFWLHMNDFFLLHGLLLWFDCNILLSLHLVMRLLIVVWMSHRVGGSGMDIRSKARVRFLFFVFPNFFFLIFFLSVFLFLGYLLANLSNISYRHSQVQSLIPASFPSGTMMVLALAKPLEKTVKWFYSEYMP